MKAIITAGSPGLRISRALLGRCRPTSKSYFDFNRNWNRDPAIVH
jgi:hypothetical protein